MQGLVTVFGGTGFVGKYAVRALARAGWRIRVAARNPLRAPELRVMGEVGQIECVYADLKDRASVQRALEGATAVVNLVAVLFESGGQTFDALQAKGAASVAQAAAACGITRFVQVSAIGADAASASAYARAKAEGEAAVRAAIPSAVILRPSIVFGPEDQFFNRFAAMAAISPVLPVVGAKTRFQPVYVGDVGQAVAASLALEAAAGRTFELGGPKVHSFAELMELMLSVIQRRRALLAIPFGLAGMIGAVGDLQASLGMPPQVTTDQVRLLQVDNIATEGSDGLSALGLEPTALEAILPAYLWRFREGGQFAPPSGAAPVGH